MRKRFWWDIIIYNTIQLNIECRRYYIREQKPFSHTVPHTQKKNENKNVFLLSHRRHVGPIETGTG